ncbi:MAG: EF-hand domain-containing protein [Paracoccaceae bacterium]
MNRTLLMMTLAAGFAAGAALAQTVVTDVDGDTVFSIEELQAAYPDLTAELFAQMDFDSSGAVDADELQAARESGLVAS